MEDTSKVGAVNAADTQAKITFSFQWLNKEIETCNTAIEGFKTAVNANIAIALEWHVDRTLTALKKRQHLMQLYDRATRSATGEETTEIIIVKACTSVFKNALHELVDLRCWKPNSTSAIQNLKNVAEAEAAAEIAQLCHDMVYFLSGVKLMQSQFD